MVALDAGLRAHHQSCPLNARNVGKSSNVVSRKAIQPDILFIDSVDYLRILDTTAGSGSDPTAKYCACGG